MRKLSFLLSVLMIAAFVLTACGPAGEDTATPGVGTPGTGGIATLEPTVGAGMPTAAATEPAATMAPTMAATEPAVETPTVAAGGETPQAGVPVTGNECRLRTVQGLLDSEVVDAQNNQVGDVDSVIVLRDASAAQMGGADAMTTPAATAAAGATPAATDAAATDAAPSFDGAAPQIAYLVVDLENEDDEALIPFQGLNLEANAGENGAMQTPAVGATTDPMQTPAAGAATLDPNQTPAAGTTGDDVDAGDCVVVASNLQADTLADLPRLTDDVDFSADNWDEQFRTYWSGQGVTIPAFGENNLGAAVRLNDEWDAVPAENVNGDDLGEVEDFLFAADGTFDYAVLAAGGFLGIGEKYVPVPMAKVQWTANEGDDSADDVGRVVINVTDEDWQNAPSFDSMDEFDNTAEGWDTDLRGFWDTLTTP